MWNAPLSAARPFVHLLAPDPHLRRSSFPADPGSRRPDRGLASEPQTAKRGVIASHQLVRSCPAGEQPNGRRPCHRRARLRPPGRWAPARVGRALAGPLAKPLHRRRCRGRFGYDLLVRQLAAQPASIIDPQPGTALCTQHHHRWQRGSPSRHAITPPAASPPTPQSAHTDRIGGSRLNI
jgi:hypothetical protein